MRRGCQTAGNYSFVSILPVVNKNLFYNVLEGFVALTKTGRIKRKLKLCQLHRIRRGAGAIRVKRILREYADKRHFFHCASFPNSPRQVVPGRGFSPSDYADSLPFSDRSVR